MQHIYVLLGSGLALVIIVLCFAPPKYWRTPSKCRLPADANEIGPAFFILVGANALTAAVRLGALLVLNRVDVRSGTSGAYTYGTPSDEDFLYFIAGVLGAIFIGLITIKDGVGRLAADSAAPGGSRALRRPRSG